MGLWSFVKDAGKKLVGRDDDEATAADAVEVKVAGDKVTLKPKSGAPMTQEQRKKIILAVGNVDGVAEVEDEFEVAGDVVEPVFHTVEKGDTLSAVAQKTLGKASRYNEIFEANKPMLSHPDIIYPGQKLRIPQDAKT